MASRHGHKVHAGRVGKSNKPADARTTIQNARTNNKPAGQKQQQRRRKANNTGKPGSNRISIVGQHREQNANGGLAIAGSSRTTAEAQTKYADGPHTNSGICISGRASSSRQRDRTNEAEQYYQGYQGDSANWQDDYASTHYTPGRRRQARRAGGVFGQCLDQVVGQASVDRTAAGGDQELAVFLHGLGKYMTATADTIARAVGSNTHAADRSARRTLHSPSTGINIAGTNKGE